MAEEKCKRCGDRAMTIDNEKGTTFWGAIQSEVETTVVRRLRMMGTYYRRNDRPDDTLITSDEKRPLCSDCWGLLVGRFMQGRSVPAMPGKEGW